MATEAPPVEPSPPAEGSPRALPLLVVGPLVVLVFGVLAVVGAIQVGGAELKHTFDSAADERACLLADSLALEVRDLPDDAHAELLARVARQAVAEVLLVAASGRVLVDEGFRRRSAAEARALVSAPRGVVEGAVGPARACARPVWDVAGRERATLLVLAPIRREGPATTRLAAAVTTLSVLLLAMAIVVTRVLGRATRSSLDYLTARVTDMAQGHAEVSPVTIRSLDEAGHVAAAFHVLAERFAEADRSYRADLEQVALLDAEQAAFLAGLSHELRTPLNAVLGFSHVLATEVDGPLSPDAREIVATIETSGAHLRGLIDDVLDLSALEGGKLELLRREVSLADVAREVVKEAAPLVLGRPVELRLEADERAVAWGDRRRIRQIATNFVSNAIKFVREGHVHVRVRSTDTAAVFEVEDTGPGIREEDLDAIFLEFRQAGDRGSKRAGAGLGLAIAKRLARMHGGRVEVVSQLGRGSTFRVLLPRPTSDGRGPASLLSIPPRSER